MKSDIASSLNVDKSRNLLEIRIKIILNIPFISLINQSVYYNMSDSEEFVDDNATEESEDELEPNQPRVIRARKEKK